MKLSIFVVEHDGSLINTVTSTVLPNTASEAELSAAHFLDGQEREAILSVLLSRPTKLTLQVISTWECNLRCTHCFAHKRLVRTPKKDIDGDAVVRLLNRFNDHYHLDKLNINFLGGEPTLRSSQNLKIIEKISRIEGPLIRFTGSTNLVKDLTPDDIEFIGKLRVCQVSIDGSEVSHNKQRHSSDIDNPYRKTLSNLKILIDHGLRNIRVVASVNSNEATMEDKIEFYRELLKIGFPFESIGYGHFFPTTANPIKINGDCVLPLPSPCCVYQHMRWFSVEDGDKLVVNMYDGDGDLGTCDTPLDEIAERHRNFILRRMPMLHDRKCSRCPVLGQCWGGCVGSHYSMHEPGKWCTQSTVDKATALRDYMVKNIKQWLVDSKDQEHHY